MYKKLILIGLLIFSLIQPSWAASKEEKKSQETKYVKIEKQELELIRRQAILSRSLLQRIRDLEKLYKNIKSIVETIKTSVDFFKDFLKIDDLDIFDFDNSNDNEFEHISGVIMSPGFVEFIATTTDPELSFDDHGLSILEMDIYYNKNLFHIDHIESDGAFGDEFKKVSLSTKTSGAKDRIKLPLSDVLANEVSFKVYLAPNNHETIEVGQKTKLDIKYFKRVSKNEDGERIPPIEYGFVEGSAQEIEVAVK